MMMSSLWQLLPVCVALLALSEVGEAQFKTAGIKTRQPVPPSANLQFAGNASEYSQTQTQTQYSSYSNNYSNNYSNSGYANYIPAETYQGVSGHYVQPVNQVTPAPVVLDEISLFINKTRSSMASGVCFEEVP